MNVLAILIPASLILGGVGLAAFFWTLKRDQYDDPEGDRHRILSSEWDERPRPDPDRERSGPKAEPREDGPPEA